MRKGVILAGGTGSRLYPLSAVINKHLLPVYNQPLIYYPLKTLISAGIEEILIVTGGNNTGAFLKLLGSGKQFGLKKIYYAYQEGAGGIAEALSLAEDFAGKDKIAVILGDNVFADNMTKLAKEFDKQKRGAKLFLKRVNNPERFGVAKLKNNKLIDIVEKPKKPESNLVVSGLYMYDNQLFDIIKTLKPSNRGELEITDVNNFYIKQKTVTYEILNGFWSDAGTFDSLLKTALYIRNKKEPKCIK